MPRERERPISIIEEATEVIDPQAAHGRFRDELQKGGKLKKLHDEATRRGFQPHDRPEETFAIKYRAKASDDVRPPRGGPGEAARDVEFELVGQSLSKGDAEAAVATCTVRAGRNEQTYELLLEAPGGNFQQAREYTVENDQVVDAHSWWSAWTGCLSRDCASTCLNALWACSGTWAAYFWCVVAACGGCVLRCAGCATCDCSWWCRWAAGCCDA